MRSTLASCGCRRNPLTVGVAGRSSAADPPIPTVMRNAQADAAGIRGGIFPARVLTELPERFGRRGVRCESKCTEGENSNHYGSGAHDCLLALCDETAHHWTKSARRTMIAELSQKGCDHNHKNCHSLCQCWSRIGPRRKRRSDPRDNEHTPACSCSIEDTAVDLRMPSYSKSDLSRAGTARKPAPPDQRRATGA